MLFRMIMRGMFAGCIGAVFLLVGCIDTVEKLPVVQGARYVCRIDALACTGCGICIEACPRKAIVEMQLDNTWICVIDPDKCDGCGDCIGSCEEKAIVRIPWFD